MNLSINGTSLTKFPSQMTVGVQDLDNADSSIRGLDGTLNRDRITTKRSIELTWDMLTWEELSSLLSLMTGTFFPVYYPDPLTGIYATKTFYVGDRKTPVAVSRSDTIVWRNLSITLTER